MFLFDFMIFYFLFCFMNFLFFVFAFYYICYVSSEPPGDGDSSLGCFVGLVQESLIALIAETPALFGER